MGGANTEIRLNSGIEFLSKAPFTQSDTQIPSGEQVHVWIDRNVEGLPLLYGQKMTADGSGNLSGETRMYFPMNGDRINVYSLHTNADIPVDSFPEEPFVHEVSSDQRTEAEYVYSDLFYSKEDDVAKTSGQIFLTYYHNLSKIRVAVTAKDGLTVSDISGISITGVKRSASVSVNKSAEPYALSVEPVGEPSSVEIGKDLSTDFTEGTVVYNDAIMVPQTVEAGSEFVKVTLQDGREVAYRLSSPVTFESGRKYTLHMTVSFTEISVSTSISDWTDSDGPIIAVSDTVKFTVNYTDGTSEQTMTVDTDTIRFNGAGKTVRSIELPDYGKSYLIGRVDATELVLNFDDEGNLVLRAAEQGYIPIGSYAEMQLINAMEDKSGRYRQEADIDLLSEPWIPITNFTGEFDGAGYKFSNILIDLDNASDGSGLFGSISGATLSDIHLVSGIVEGGSHTGAICATAFGGTIEYCTNAAEIHGTSVSNLGGILGYMNGNSMIIANCENSGNISGQCDYGGGIFGRYHTDNANVLIEHCKNQGTISASAGRAIGGIAGMGATRIEHCTNSGLITSDAHICGGIIGSAASGIILNNCSNTGRISISGYRCGGIAGSTSSGSITACFNSGEIMLTSANHVYCGGIVGETHCDISACYNTGVVSPVTGSSSSSFSVNAGGIAGYLIGGSITSCYNSGYIRPGTAVTIRAGSILGDWNGNYISTVTSCYWKEDEGVSAAIGTDVKNTNLTVTDVYSFADTFTPDAQTHPEWGIGGGETFGWWKNYDGNGGLPQLWWE